MLQGRGPYPVPNWRKLAAQNIFPPETGNYSGEITANVKNAPIAAARFNGVITDVWMSIGASGKDDTNPLQISGEVTINGVSCLTTKPSIAHVSGEASQQKTTKVTGDTGIAQAVINASANSVTQGDVISFEFTVERTGSPTTEMSNPVIVVEFEPTN